MPEYPLLPLPIFEHGNPPKLPRFVPNVPKLSSERQGQRLGPKFDRLQDVLTSENDGLSLRDDPSSIAPERALVLEIAGLVGDFYALVGRVAGLEYLADEEIGFDPDEDFFEIDTRKDQKGRHRTDKPISGRLYLAMPDVGALRQLLSLWNRWQREEVLPYGLTPWRDLFASLRDVRAWGATDRLTDETIKFWREEIEANPANMRRIEAELWFRESAGRRETSYRRLGVTPFLWTVYGCHLQP